MKRQKYVRFYLLLVVTVLILHNFEIGIFDNLIKTFPCIFLLVIYSRKKWTETSLLLKVMSFFYLITAVYGFFLTAFYPNEWGVMLGMIGFLFSKVFFLSNVRIINGFLAVDHWYSYLIIIALCLLGVGFLNQLPLDNISSLYIIPLFLYVLVDALTLYSIYPIRKKETNWVLGVSAVVITIFFDLVSAGNMFLHFFDDNFNISLFLGFISYIVGIEYFYQSNDQVHLELLLKLNGQRRKTGLPGENN